MRTTLAVIIGMGALALGAGAQAASCTGMATALSGEARVIFTAEEAAACKVKGEITPVPGSRITFELWLPKAGWNGKFEMVGNGGFSSAIPAAQMQRLLEAGYAVAGTDTGHTGDSPDFARGRPESMIDFAHRAVHLTAVHAKTMIKAFYGQAPSHSYFSGCSTGGNQAMAEAERYPQDFDGVIAGAPGANRTHLTAGFLWMFIANHRLSDGSEITPASKLDLVSRAALAACRKDNGGKAGGLAEDAWLNDPGLCRFDPGALRCRSQDGPDCLTGEQVGAIRAIYAGSKSTHGYPPGSETAGANPNLPGWALYWADPRDPAKPARLSFWQIWAQMGDGYTGRWFDFGKDMAAADARLAGFVNHLAPDLTPFASRGGKLIAYQGTADPVVPYAYVVDYARAVTAATPRAGEVYRLFLVPGMGHCAGGPGLQSVEAQSALEAWVERGVAPELLIASIPAKGQSPAISRPVCPYPEKAVFSGQGDPAKAESFACR
jgi:feruloyl esterase